MGSYRGSGRWSRAKARFVWLRNLPAELMWWNHWLDTRGSRWPDEFRARFDEASPITDALLASAIDRLSSPVVRIIDVGAGPATMVGKTFGDRSIEITPVDPLAVFYNMLLRRNRLNPPVRTIRCRGEALVRRFGARSFDIACARNSIDHAHDPLRVVKNMLGVVRAGGAVLLSHHHNEGMSQDYRGLHRWNFDARDGRFIIWSVDAETDVGAELGASAKVNAWIEDDWVHCRIERLA